ncbi:MAG TPA: HD domain-containing phosphohydrolase [Pyrinomonadaceae bacterium]|nr:HD domain-containing phosphohydrolase [Pyrinomonadaceae bacterium]
MATNKDREAAAREAYLQLASAADRFERYENPHATRIAAIADRLAREFHLGAHDRDALRTAAHMHDLGEVAMERDYIHRAGSLTEEERLDLTRHPVIGEQEVARASADRAVQLLVRWHHEWWNGLGYPDGLSRNEIPLAARILRLADSYAALTDARPYRPAFTEDDAKQQMREAAGMEFDPHVLTVFLALSDMDELRSFARPAQPAVTIDDTRPLFSSFS